MQSARCTCYVSLNSSRTQNTSCSLPKISLTSHSLQSLLNTPEDTDPKYSNKLQKINQELRHFLDFASDIDCPTHEVKNFTTPFAKIGLWASRTFPRIGRTRESTPFSRGVNCNASIELKSMTDTLV